MKFTAPRSLSRSPERAFGRSIFRAPSESEDSDEYVEEESSDYDIDLSSETASSSKLSDSDSDLDISPVKPIPRQREVPTEEAREQIAETVASIRVRTRHKDPYDEWERRTRKDAFHSARKQQAAVRLSFREGRDKVHALEQQRLKAVHTKEMEQLHRALSALDIKRQQDEQNLKDGWKERNQKLWERIESVIKVEEDKIGARLEAERKVREEMERKQKAEEERRRQEEERKMKEEEQKRKEEQERQKKLLEERLEKERVEKERAEKEEVERKQAEQVKGAGELRETAGLPSAEDLWQSGLHTLKFLKTETMRAVKGPKTPDPLPSNYQAPNPPPLKKLWSAQRRKITPKVGQLTDDPREITRIVEELKAIVAPVPGPPEALHYALLSSLAKAIIRQAETEVTAHKAQAAPLAQVAVGLIAHYPPLADIFWAKLCELAGCWIAPVAADAVGDSRTISEREYAKRWSRRADELQDAQTSRLAGVLRLYLHMLFVPVRTPLPPAFRPARFWAYITRLLASPALLGRAVAPEFIYVALDVGGLQAKAIWGRQWIKLLAYIYESVQGEHKERIGGPDVGAQASRVRCILEVEKIMAAS